MIAGTEGGVVQFGTEASQTRDCCVAKNATLRAARPDPSRRKERLLRMTSHCTTTTERGPLGFARDFGNGLTPAGCLNLRSRIEA